MEGMWSLVPCWARVAAALACRLWPKMKMSVSREVKIANSTARLLLLRLMPTTTLVVCCVWKDSSFFLDRCPWRGIQHFSSDEILLWFVLCWVLLPYSRVLARLVLLGLMQLFVVKKEMHVLPVVLINLDYGPSVEIFKCLSLFLPLAKTH